MEGTMVERAEELAEIDALFARADADHDGQISFAEFRALVRELDDDTPDEALRIGFAETDVDGNGRINIDEFRDWWLSE
jgi:Ca2+-binding EF-hand superfamily protein